MVHWTFAEKQAVRWRFSWHGQTYDLIQRVVEERHYKVPQLGRLPSSKSSCTTSTQTLNATTETINDSSSKATYSNVLEMISTDVNKNDIQTHFKDDNDSDDDED